MAFKMAGSSYKKGGTKTKATLLQTEKQKDNLPKEIVAAIAKKSPTKHSGIHGIKSHDHPHGNPRTKK